MCCMCQSSHRDQFQEQNVHHDRGFLINQQLEVYLIKQVFGLKMDLTVQLGRTAQFLETMNYADYFFSCLVQMCLLLHV